MSKRLDNFEFAVCFHMVDFFEGCHTCQYALLANNLTFPYFVYSHFSSYIVVANELGENLFKRKKKKQFFHKQLPF